MKDEKSHLERKTTPYLPTMDPKEDEYRRQAQIAELNALNDALAVIRFKQHFKLFDRIDEAAWYTFETAPFELQKERGAAIIYPYLAVERLPKELSRDIVYHNEEFELGAMLCACGCGHRVDLLVPDSHQISANGGLATIRPSIAVCDAPCKSHYFITDGRVEWLPAFSQAAVMPDQIARHVSRDTRRLS